jgi:probable addiction module antidote protein
MMMMRLAKEVLAMIKTKRFDAADYLDSDEMIAAYFNEMLDTGDPALLYAAIGDIAKARSMAKIANETGLNRENLYRQLSKGGNPSFATIQKVTSALGIELRAVAAK